MNWQPLENGHLTISSVHIPLLWILVWKQNTGGSHFPNKTKINKYFLGVDGRYTSVFACKWHWIDFKVKILNQSKPVTPRRHWGTPTDAETVMTAHRRLSSATRSNDGIHSLMWSFHDLCGLPLRRLPSTSPVVWSLAAYHGDRHGRTTITCNAWQLTAEAPEVQLGYWPVE